MVKRFTDNAGCDRHCWECGNAIGWGAPATAHNNIGICTAHGNMKVTKHDSPDNPCSIAAGCIEYTSGRRWVNDNV